MSRPTNIKKGKFVIFWPRKGQTWQPCSIVSSSALSLSIYICRAASRFAKSADKFCSPCFACTHTAATNRILFVYEAVLHGTGLGIDARAGACIVSCASGSVAPNMVKLDPAA